MEEFIRVPYGSTVHGDEEIAAVVNVLNTTTQMSKNVLSFEEKIAESFNKKNGVMVNSGSSALYVLIEALNLPKGSEVITPALTFATTVGCLVKNDLIPHFIDVGVDTYCIDVEQLELAINEKTSAIIAPDLMGNICEWEKIQEIVSRKNKNIKIICDSADTLGASLFSKSTGSWSECKIPSFVVFVLDTIEETVKDTSTSLEIEFPVITSPSVNVPTMFASSNSVTDCIPSWNVITSLTVAVAPELAPVII